MDYVHEYAAGDEVASADLNNIQSQAASLYQVTWSWRGRRPTLSCDGANIIVGAHQGCAAGTSQADATLIAGSGLTTTALSGRSSNTWYYVYAYDNAGVCAYEWSTTVPDASASTKTGDGTRAYVGCFYATAAAVAKPFRAIGGRYLYRVSAIASLLALSGGTAAAWADVGLTAFLPPHVRIADLFASVAWSSGTAGLQVRTKGDTTSQLEVILAAGREYARLEIETNASQVIEYQIVNGASADLQVMGFSE